LRPLVCLIPVPLTMKLRTLPVMGLAIIFCGLAQPLTNVPESPHAKAETRHAIVAQVKPEKAVEAVKTAHTQQQVSDTNPPVQAAPAPPTYPTEPTDIMTQAGLTAEEQVYARQIVDHEDGNWCPTRWQGTSAEYCGPYDGDDLKMENPWVGYGMCQSTPGIKMAIMGDDYKVNPVTQMKWCDSYAKARYGSWAAAWAHWQTHRNW
jgi:hypothetical protein